MVEQEAGTIHQGGTIMLASWEFKILSDCPGHQPETEYEKHKAAEDMFFLKLAQKLRDEGRCAEALVRANISKLCGAERESQIS